MSTMASPAKPILSCIRCSERKVKCNKQNPCNACTRHNVPCIFRPPKPSQKKRGLVKDKLLEARLKRYESLLQEQGIDPDQIAIPVTSTLEAEHHRQSSRSEVPEPVWKLPPQAAIFKPQLLHGQRGTELVDNSFMSRVAEEFHDGEAAPGEDSANDASDGGNSDGDFAYALGGNATMTGPSHPPAEHAHHLWHTFIENVNPLTKLVHVPSLQPAIEKAIANIKHIPRGFEALMFAIYSMAVLSLTEDECMKTLGRLRAVLLPRYVAATKVALSRARFMSSASIVVLQALVLHIFCIRNDYEPRAVWSLTGLAIRVAEGMGMRLDGTLLGLSPFETEIRRRIWWQLKMHDFRAAELSGQPKFRAYDMDETSPKKPANVNDSDLHPAMPRAAAESTRPTEMIWCMFRLELASFAATQIARMQKLGRVSDGPVAMDDPKIKDVFIEELEDTIETKYLRFCDPSQPLQLKALLGARCTANLVRFMAHHPRRWANLDQVPASEQQLVWSIVVQLLEQYDMMQSSPQLQRFAWNVPYFIQWHVVIHALDTLRAHPLHLDAVKVWRLIDNLYKNNSEILLNIKKPIFVAVGSLCLKAFNALTAALTKENRNVPDPPEYITKLREQREAAKVRREAAIARSKRLEILGGERRLTTIDAESTWPDTNQSSAEVQAEAQPPQYPAVKQLETLFQGSTRTEDDAFWLSNDLGGIFFADGAADPMNVDMDDILAQDYWLDTPNGEVVDWVQWDAWLGNLDPVIPTIGTGPE